MASYSEQFEQAWALYRDGATAVEKNRSGKLEAFKVWKFLGLDKKLDNVLAWVSMVGSTYSSGYRPGFQVFLKKHDFSESIEAEVPKEALQEAPGGKDFDWAYLITSAKKEALRTKQLHRKNNPYLYPETIVLAVKDLARGIESGPFTVERALELAQARADKVKAEVKNKYCSSTEKMYYSKVADPDKWS